MEQNETGEDSTNDLLRRLKLIKLNTNQHCLLCLQEAEVSRNDNSNSTLESNEENCQFSLQSFFKCLKIDLQTIVNELGNPKALLEELGVSPQHRRGSLTEEQVSATLCQSCRKTVQRTSELFRRLEKVQMELDHYLKCVHEEISKSLSEDYSPLMGNGGTSISVLVFVDELRKKLLRKSSKIKFYSSSPTVKLDRLPGVHTNKSKSHEVNVPKRSDVFLEPSHKCHDLFSDSKNDFKSEESYINEACRSRDNEEESSPAFPEEKSSEGRPEDILFPTEMKLRTEISEENPTSTEANITSEVTNAEEEVNQQGKSITDPVSFSSSSFANETAEFPNKMELRKFIYDEQTNEYHCSACNDKFPSRYKATSHYDAVHLFIRHKCSFCLKLLKTKETLTVHVKRKHIKTAGLINRFSCKIYGRSFLQKRQLKDRISCDTEKIKMHQIQNRVGDANYHEEIEVNMNGSLENAGTSLSAKNNRGFKIKKYTHKQAKKKHYCIICKKGFTRAYSVKDHYNSVHLQIQHKCKFCPQLFRWRHNLLVHLNQHHTDKGERRYYCCKICGNSFTTNSYLKRHHQQTRCGSNNNAIQKPEVQRPTQDMVQVNINTDVCQFQPEATINNTNCLQSWE